MTPTAGPIKRKPENRQRRGEVNTDGMESQERTSFKRWHRHIVLRPSKARAVQEQRHEQKGQSPRTDFFIWTADCGLRIADFRLRHSVLILSPSFGYKNLMLHRDRRNQCF